MTDKKEKNKNEAIKYIKIFSATFGGSLLGILMLGAIDKYFRDYIDERLMNIGSLLFFLLIPSTIVSLFLLMMALPYLF